MTSMETEYLKGLDGTYSQNRGQGYRGDKNNWGDKVAIGAMHSVNPPHSSTPQPFLDKEGGSPLPKLIEMGVGGGLKTFARKTKTYGQLWTIIGGGVGGNLTHPMLITALHI